MRPDPCAMALDPAAAVLSGATLVGGRRSLRCAERARSGLRCGARHGARVRAGPLQDWGLVWLAGRDGTRPMARNSSTQRSRLGTHSRAAAGPRPRWVTGRDRRLDSVRPPGPNAGLGPERRTAAGARNLWTEEWCRRARAQNSAGRFHVKHKEPRRRVRPDRSPGSRGPSSQRSTAPA